jgi:hypothetical protein
VYEVGSVDVLFFLRVGLGGVGCDLLFEKMLVHEQWIVCVV